MKQIMNNYCGSKISGESESPEHYRIYNNPQVENQGEGSSGLTPSQRAVLLVNLALVFCGCGAEARNSIENFECTLKVGGYVEFIDDKGDFVRVFYGRECPLPEGAPDPTGSGKEVCPMVTVKDDGHYSVFEYEDPVTSPLSVTVSGGLTEENVKVSLQGTPTFTVTEGGYWDNERVTVVEEGEITESTVSSYSDPERRNP